MYVLLYNSQLTIVEKVYSHIFKPFLKSNVNGGSTADLCANTYILTFCFNRISRITVKVIKKCWPEFGPGSLNTLRAKYEFAASNTTQTTFAFYAYFVWKLAPLADERLGRFHRISITTIDEIVLNVANYYLAYRMDSDRT
jgi:type II restriction/modification system DNA methylase subunit YeeA